MSENGRMTIEERVAGLEARLGANDELVKELRDAMITTAHLEAHQSRLLKEHGNWLQDHDSAIVSSRKDFDARIRILDERIASLVSGFGEFLRQREA